MQHRNCMLKRCVSSFSSSSSCFRFPVARHITCASASKEDLPDVDAEAGSPRALGAEPGYLTVKQSG